MVINQSVSCRSLSSTLQFSDGDKERSNAWQLGNIDLESLPTFSDIDYFELDDSMKAIIPGLQFDYNGTIMSYSGLTVFKAVPSFIQYLNHYISFSIWRPRGQGLYDRVGHNELIFTPGDVRDGLLPIDNSTGSVPADLAFFRFSDKEPEMHDKMQPFTVEPGDVMGWEIPVKQSIDRPLSLVYRQSHSSGAVNGFRFRSSRQVTCSVPDCAGAPFSIVPFLLVKLGKCILYRHNTHARMHAHTDIFPSQLKF